MRHVSRNHRVAWTPKSKSNTLIPKTFFEDMLTKNHFTRDEWNHLLRLVNIMSFSMFSCGHYSPTNNFISMSKRLIQDGKPGEEERAVPKSKPMWSVMSKFVDRSPIALGSSESRSLELSKHKVQIWTSPIRGDPQRGLNENTASSSKVWHSDVNPNNNTRRFVAETKRAHGYNLISPQPEDSQEQRWQS